MLLLRLYSSLRQLLLLLCRPEAVRGGDTLCCSGLGGQPGPGPPPPLLEGAWARGLACRACHGCCCCCWAGLPPLLLPPLLPVQGLLAG